MSVVDDLFDVRGKAALVTGGASGLGYAFASILAECGANVTIADWDAESLEKAAARWPTRPPPPARPPARVAGRRSRRVGRVRPRRCAAAARRHRRGGGGRLRRPHRQRQGSIDIVFANAGVARGRPPLLPEGWLDDMSMTDYKALIDVNLHGVVYTVQAAAQHMKNQRSGHHHHGLDRRPPQRPVHALLVHDRQGRRRQLHQAGRA